VDGIDDRLRRRSDTRGSVATCAGRRRRGERRRKGVGVVAGYATKAVARRPYRRRVECGQAATATRRSDTRGFEHKRSEWHGCRDGRSVGALLCGCTCDSAAVAHGASWRRSADAWAPAQKAETDRWDPGQNYFQIKNTSERK
jgi:hypothetical protein